MSDENLPEVDLFGDPVICRDPKVGRPEHVRTRANADKVTLMFACDYSVKEVAAAMGLSQPTFRKHYFHEIARRKTAALRLTGLQLQRLNDEAGKGNVTAEKALRVLVEKEQLKNLGSRVADRGKGEPKSKAPPLGKKEQAKVDAAATQGRFGTRPAPQRLVN